MHKYLHTRTEPLLLPLYPRLILLSLLERGHDEGDVLEGMDLTADQLHDEHYRLTIEQHEQFILRALDLTKDPHFAIELNERHSADTDNLALLAAANSGQIAKALHLIARYLKIVTRVFSVRSLETEQAAVMTLDVHLEHELVIYFAVSTFALFVDRFFRKMLNGSHIVRRVEVPVAEPPGLLPFAQESRLRWSSIRTPPRCFSIKPCSIGR